MNLSTQSGHPLLVTKKYLSTIILYFLKVLHVGIPKSKNKKNLLGHFINVISMFERFFVNIADFRSFSEAMKYKRINDISEILEVLYCLRVF